MACDAKRSFQQNIEKPAQPRMPQPSQAGVIDHFVPHHEAAARFRGVAPFCDVRGAFAGLELEVIALYAGVRLRARLSSGPGGIAGRPQ